MTHNLPAGLGSTWSFGYNAASQITQVSRTNDAYAFTGYASVDRAYTVNGLKQYSGASGGVSYGYDANGNLTQSSTPQGSVAYGYDAENRLVTASNGVELRYDPLGRLWQVSGSGVATTQFLYDGDQLSAEYDGSGALLRRYVHSTGDDDPIIWYEGSGVTNPRYLYANHQGSVVAIVAAPRTGRSLQPPQLCDVVRSIRSSARDSRGSTKSRNARRLSG